MKLYQLDGILQDKLSLHTVLRRQRLHSSSVLQEKNKTPLSINISVLENIEVLYPFCEEQKPFIKI